MKNMSSKNPSLGLEIKLGKVRFWAVDMENIWFWKPKYIKYEIQLLIGKIIS